MEIIDQLAMLDEMLIMAGKWFIITVVVIWVGFGLISAITKRRD